MDIQGCIYVYKKNKLPIRLFKKKYIENNKKILYVLYTTTKKKQQ